MPNSAVSNSDRTFREATDSDVKLRSCPNYCHHPLDERSGFKFDYDFGLYLNNEDLGLLNRNSARTPNGLLIEFKSRSPRGLPDHRLGNYSQIHARLFPAYRISADGQSIKGITLKWEGQQFKSAATLWETENSPLINTTRAAKYNMPLVDGAGTIVGYLGRAKSPRDVWKNSQGEMIYMKASRNDDQDLRDFGFRPLGGGDNCDLILSINGDLVDVVSVYDRALEPSLLFEFLTALWGARGLVMALTRKVITGTVKTGLKTIVLSQSVVKTAAKKLFGRNLGAQVKSTAVRKLTTQMTKSGDGLVFVEIGAGDLNASLIVAKSGKVRVIAVDPASKPTEAAIKELEKHGGKFIKGTAADIPSNSADHVFQYFPWRIEGTGQYLDGGTWRLIEDTKALLKPNGAAHFVTESKITAEFLVKEASKRNFRVVLTESTAGSAAKGASGSGVPNFSSDLGVWMVNIYK